MIMIRQWMPDSFTPVRTRSELRHPSLWVILLFGLLLAGCTDENKSAGPDSDQPKLQSAPSRWYAAENVARGAPIYAQHCAACHGNGGQGSFTWRKPDADGKYPPPPLNGTGHAWHHPMSILRTGVSFLFAETFQR